jgi:hypothetical protein
LRSCLFPCFISKITNIKVGSPFYQALTPLMKNVSTFYTLEHAATIRWHTSLTSSVTLLLKNTEHFRCCLFFCNDVNYKMLELTVLGPLDGANICIYTRGIIKKYLTIFFSFKQEGAWGWEWARVTLDLHTCMNICLLLILLSCWHSAKTCCCKSCVSHWRWPRNLNSAFAWSFTRNLGTHIIYIKVYPSRTL